MSVMSALETRAVWAMAGRGKLQHSITFRFVRELDSWSDNPPTIHLSNLNRSDRIHVVQLIMTGIKKPSH